MTEIEDIAILPASYHSTQQLQHVLERAQNNSAVYPPAEMFELVEQLSIHGLVDDFDGFVAARKQQITRSNALARYVGHYRDFLSSCEKSLGQGFSKRLRRNLLAEVPQLVKRGGRGDRLLIVVPTFYNNVMLSIPLLDAFLDHLKIDTLFLKATHTRFPYYDGVFGFGTTKEWATATIGEFCTSRNYSEVDLVGASSGGFFAMWLGAQIEARKVCVFGSDIVPTMRSKHLNRQDIARSVEEDSIGDLADLSKIGAIHAYSGNLRSRDVECLTYLEQFPNVTSKIEVGVDHLVLLNLLSRGYSFPELAL